MAAPALNDSFATEALRMQGDVKKVGRYTSIFSSLMKKDWLADGTGFNWQSVVTERTVPATYPLVWTPIQANSNSNTCVPTGILVNSATFIQSYSANQVALNSEQICLDDARAGYDFLVQTENKKLNFEDNIVDAWNDNDRVQYILSSKWKYIANNSLSFTSNSTSFPLVTPTAPPSRLLMDVFYRKLKRDGSHKAGGAYSMKDGNPIFLAIMSSEAQQAIIMTDANVRQDFRWAEATMGNKATLLNEFGCDRPYGGFFQMCDDRMPRYDFVAGAWVERQFFDGNNQTSIGNEAEVSTLYENAAYEDIIFWHPESLIRMMPKPRTTVGADTEFKAVDYSGEVRWLNIPNATDNPDESYGFWRAVLKAAYRPELTRYAYVLRVNRCTNQLYTFGACS